MDPVKFVAFVGSLPWLAYFLVRPRIITIFVIVISLIQLNWFSRYYGVTPAINRISLAFAGLLGARVIADLAFKRYHIVKQRQVLLPLISFSVGYFLLVVISSVYNNESLLLGIYELRYYYFGLAICFSLYFYFNSNLTINIFKKTMVIIGVVQLPFSVTKWLVAGGGSIRTLDSVSGTFSGYGELVGCQIFVISLLLFEQLSTKRPLLKINSLDINNYILCFLVLVPMLLSKSRTFTLFLVVVFIFVWSYNGIVQGNLILCVKKMISIVVLGCILLTLLYFVFWRKNYDLNVQFSPSYVVNYYMRDPITDCSRFMNGADASMGRIRAIVEAFRLIQKDLIHIFVGYGSGATAESSFLKTAGKYYQEYGLYAGIGRNQYSKNLTELGVIGIGLLVSFFCVIWKRINVNLFEKYAIKHTYVLLLFSLFLLSAYTITLSTFFFSFTLAFFLATLQAEIDRRVQNNSE